jgi:hypothetical protein
MIPIKLNLTGGQAFKIFIFIFGLAVGYFAKGYFHTCEECPEIVASDTSYVDIPQPKDSSGYEPQIIIMEKPVNEDSIYQAAKEYWYAIFVEQFRNDDPDIYYQGTHRYKASHTLKKPNIKGSYSFNSRIPLDPEGYFLDDFTVTERIITNTVVEKEVVTYNPRFFLGGAVRVDETLDYTVYGGVNLLSFRHLKSYLQTGAVYDTEEGWHIEVEAGIKIEF